MLGMLAYALDRASARFAPRLTVVWSASLTSPTGYGSMMACPLDCNSSSSPWGSSPTSSSPSTISPRRRAMLDTPYRIIRGQVIVPRPTETKAATTARVLLDRTAR